MGTQKTVKGNASSLISTLLLRRRRRRRPTRASVAWRDEAVQMKRTHCRCRRG